MVFVFSKCLEKKNYLEVCVFIVQCALVEMIFC